MQYLRGSRHDYDEWANNGAAGWAYKDVLPYFIKSEDQRNGEFIRTGRHPFHSLTLIFYTRCTFVTMTPLSDCVSGLSANVSQKPAVQTSPNFRCILLLLGPPLKAMQQGRRHVFRFSG